MSTLSWHQLVIKFAAVPQVEGLAVRHLGPALTAAENRGDIAAWFFIRKGHQWRLRYRPANANPRTPPTLRDCLNELTTSGRIARVAENVYEPEIRAFGGDEGIATAHRLWHADSRALMAGLADGQQPGCPQRRELSMILLSAMLRDAGLDWYEQGDVWARVAAHREQPDASATRSAETAVHRLIAVDPHTLTRLGGTLAPHHALVTEYQQAGRTLGQLYWAGGLTRGLRAILAHHVVFAWNRRGLSGSTQGILATTARNVVFGPAADQALLDACPVRESAPTG